MTDSPTLATTAFERATAVVPDGDRWVADVDLDWAAPTGPNGGYLAAIVVRAVEAAADPEHQRQLRSLSLQYLRSASEGPLELDVRTVRAGRRLASVAVTARQQGREVLTGFATLATRGLDQAGQWAPPFPDVAGPPDPDAGAAPMDRFDRAGGHWLELPPGLPPIVERLRIAPRLGTGPYTGRKVAPGDPIETGGWMGSPEPQRIDAAYLAQLTDFWWPPALEVLTVPAIAPTIDLTIHVQADLPVGGLDPAAVLGTYRTTVAANGLGEEDGTLFGPNGTLLARSRQLALLAPLSA
ncbi:MAG: thioesterase family protein [Patulibacter sp.]|nr:thioesterase family protein [Patulibacter sp.]